MTDAMNFKDYLRRQFAYNEWANREVLSVIRKNGDERSLQLFAHILAAERVWLDRLKQQPQSVAVWPKPDLAQCEAHTFELARLWCEYLDEAPEDLTQAISYKNSKGEPWTSTILDILSHVVLHSAYHRGQVALQLRTIGETPAYTDFIHGVRQGMVKS